MLLSSLILVLQEILEAAILISLLLVLSPRRGESRVWLMAGVAIGVTGALIYASQLARVSAWYDFAGQELVNATLQLGVFFGILLLLPLIVGQSQRVVFIVVLKTVVLALAMVREGSEIAIYLFQVIARPDLVSPLMLGAFLGAGIGSSIGALVYYGLLSLPGQRGRIVALLLLAFLAAKLLSQVAVLLVQANWLPAGPMLWNSGHLLPESSLAGQMLHALVGYESTPGLVQLLAYMGGLILLSIGIAWLGFVRTSRDRP